MELDQAASHITQRWGNKTLSDLRAEAKKEAIGTAFESLRVDSGPGLMLIVCLTSRDQISIVEKALGLTDSAPAANWDELTLVDMVFRTEATAANGLSYEDIHDDTGKRVALALCGVGPTGVKILETLFSF